MAAAGGLLTLARDHRGAALLAITAVAVVAVFLHDAVAQDVAYHGLADTRTLLGIPNALNVLSNVPFLVAGAWGLARTPRLHAAVHRPAWVVLCAGVALVSAGSARYHLAPENATLMWDRLPIAAAFMGLFALVLHDRVSRRLARWTLGPAVILAMATVVFWHAGELRGLGDLRPYALVQGIPLVLIPAILTLYRDGVMRAGWMWATLVTYGLAKVTEHLDWTLWELGAGLVSGHTLKHLLAALAVAFALAAFTRAAPEPG